MHRHHGRDHELVGRRSFDQSLEPRAYGRRAANDGTPRESLPPPRARRSRSCRRAPPRPTESGQDGRLPGVRRRPAKGRQLPSMLVRFTADHRDRHDEPRTPSRAAAEPARYRATAPSASLMLKCPANAKPTPCAAAIPAPALVEPSIQIGGMGASLGMTSTNARGWPSGKPLFANAKSSSIWSFTSPRRTNAAGAPTT